MSFILNKKEEVIKVEMTKHGRKMLGLGYFKPSYFSFFDDSVIYDNSYTGFSNENTNDISDRILYKSLTFSSLNNLTDQAQNIMGRSDPFSDNAPAWSIKALNGKIFYNKEQSTYYKKYFSFDDINCNISFKDKTQPSKDINIETDYILLDLQEFNVEEDVSNFEIELLYYNSLMSGSNGAIEKKLLFLSPKNNVIDDILYDEVELPSKYFDINFNEEHASYFYDILVDEEIDTDYIANAGSGIYETIRGFIGGINSALRFPNRDPRGPDGNPPPSDDPEKSGLTSPNIGPGLRDGDRIRLGPNGEVQIQPRDEDIFAKQPSDETCVVQCCP